MTCKHDLNSQSDAFWTAPECDIHVECDLNCKALTDPQTLNEWIAAAEHWRHHSYLSGCSHGC